MNQEEIKSNLLNADQWLRILFMAGYAVATWLTLVVLVVVVLAQAVIALITGSSNANLQRVGLLFGIYLHQIVQYLTYNTDYKPFPFNAFPDGSNDPDPEAATESADPAPASSPAESTEPEPDPVAEPEPPVLSQTDIVTDGTPPATQDDDDENREQGPPV